MERVLKFRAWHKVNKVMYEHKDIPVLLKNVGNDSVWSYMQFTGLVDKKGIEIYEGDIVSLKSRYRDREYTGEIAYAKGGFYAKGFCFTHYDNPYDIFSEEQHLIEVIGNIHENPELL